MNIRGGGGGSSAAGRVQGRDLCRGRPARGRLCEVQGERKHLRYAGSGAGGRGVGGHSGREQLRECSQLLWESVSVRG